LDLGSLLGLASDTIGFVPKIITQKSTKITKVLSGVFTKMNRTFVLGFICMQGQQIWKGIISGYPKNFGLQFLDI